MSAASRGPMTARAQVRDLRNFHGEAIEDAPMTEVKVGDWVGFKSDVEQSGRISGIDGGTLILSAGGGRFDGGYIGGKVRTTMRASDCWVE